MYSTGVRLLMIDFVLKLIRPFAPCPQTFLHFSIFLFVLLKEVCVRSANSWSCSNSKFLRLLTCIPHMVLKVKMRAKNLPGIRLRTPQFFLLFNFIGLIQLLFSNRLPSFLIGRIMIYFKRPVHVIYGHTICCPVDLKLFEFISFYLYEVLLYFLRLFRLLIPNSLVVSLSIQHMIVVTTVIIALRAFFVQLWFVDRELCFSIEWW